MSNCEYFFQSLLTCVLSTQKNHLIEMVLLSTYNICLLVFVMHSWLKSWKEFHDSVGWGSNSGSLDQQLDLPMIMLGDPAPICQRHMTE